LWRHNYAHIFDVCDRVNLMQKGEITFDRSTKETSVEELMNLVLHELRSGAGKHWGDPNTKKCGLRNEEVGGSGRTSPTSQQTISRAGGRQHAADLSGGAADDFCQCRMDINEVDQRLDVVAPFHHGKHSME